MSPSGRQENQQLILSQLSGPPSERVSRLSGLLDEFIVRWTGYASVSSNLVNTDMFEIIELGVEVMDREIGDLRVDDLEELKSSWDQFKNLVSACRKKPTHESVSEVSCAYREFKKFAFSGEND